MTNNDALPARVLCAGILVADIFVPFLPSLPAAGELLATDDFLLDTGGCAANVATCLSRLGVGSAVFGRIGNDVFGDFVLADLRAKSVDVTGIRRSTHSGTSKTVVLPVIGEDRRFIHTFGANTEFCEEDLASVSSGQAEILYLGGFLIMPALATDAVVRAFRSAQKNGITTVLDVVVPAGEASAAMHSLSEILPYTDYFLPNDDEARALTGLENPYDQAKRFREQGCENVLISRGKDGALLNESAIVLDAPSYEVNVVDGSGAGDALAAGFITGLLEGWKMAETLRFASAIGASACTRLGCTTGVFTRPEADEFIRRNPWKFAAGNGMALESMIDLLRHANLNGYAVGYFEAWDSYSLETVLEAAEEEMSPVILGFGGMMADSRWLDEGGVELLGAMGVAVARRSQVPVSLLLNEAQTFDQAVRGIDAGFNAVMLDTSSWPLDKAVEAVSRLASLAHARGVTVEAEFGRLPDATADGVDDSTAYLTDPDQAAEFVAATRADCLAVSIGNVHLLTAHEATVDLTRLEAICARTNVPLVIHGGTGFPARAVPEAISRGVAKFNVGTILKRTVFESIREQAGVWPANANAHDVLGSHKDFDFLAATKLAMKQNVKELIRLYGCTRRAAEKAD